MEFFSIRTERKKQKQQFGEGKLWYDTQQIDLILIGKICLQQAKLPLKFVWEEDRKQYTPDSYWEKIE